MARQTPASVTRRTTLKALAGAAALGGGAGLGGVATADADEPDGDLEALYDETIDGVVTVRTFDRQGGHPQGSGWVYDRDDATGAFVLTNWHVVADIVGADVRFSGGEWRGVSELVGADPYSDLAVLRLEDVPASVEPLSLADTPPSPGATVAAFGSPLGLEGSMSTGTVSAVGRTTTVGFGGAVYTVTDTIQTDAAINPGNSGGPLVSTDGLVVGVNFAGVQFFAGQNVNFAVSGTMARRVVPELVETGTFAHPYLGIRGVTLSPTVARLNGIDPTTEGVVVESTVAGYPASDELVGAETTERVTGIPIGGDVVLALDGTAVGDTDALQRTLFAAYRPDDSVTLTVVRDGTSQEVEVTLAEKPLPLERNGVRGPSM